MIEVNADTNTGMGAIGRMQVVVRCERVSHLYLCTPSVHAGTAEPLRVSPPEAVAYLLELTLIGGCGEGPRRSPLRVRPQGVLCIHTYIRTHKHAPSYIAR